MNMRTGKKAQASTEYLVILAVAIAIALTVIMLLTNLTSVGSKVSDRDSRIYWGSTGEISLLEWVMRSSGQDQIVVRNDKNFDILIKSVTIGDRTVPINKTISPGSRETLSGSWADCEKGADYSYSVSFLYDNVEFGITSITFTGEKKIVGTCQ